jgi:pimeloyl-ACP methyl ester carboxylesterase
VEAALLAHRCEVYAPTLSGLAERSDLASHAINLSTHIRDIVDVIEANDLSDVVLCGHSYGGMVITGVAGQIPERIKTLFYLDACVPENGQSLFDLVGPERTQAMIDAAGETGTMLPPPSASFFMVDPANAEWVDRLCTPHPIACFIQKLHFTGNEQLVTRRTFALCARYPSINHRTYEQVKDQPGWKVASLDCGHDAMVDEPGLVADLLIEELDR